MRDFDSRGFTLVELLMALVITSLVLAAVATLAYALSSASDSTDDTTEKQAQVRYTTVRVGELIRQCKLICGAPGGDLAIWRADDNVNGKININELVYITACTGSLTLVEFDSSGNSVISRSGIGSLSTEWWLTYNGNTRYTQLIPECANVQFTLDQAAPRNYRGRRCP
jgi:prepilin-type N-terminal cleavage/methylation domain-containing protein